jgi:hypothetical protein
MTMYQLEFLKGGDLVQRVNHPDSGANSARDHGVTMMGTMQAMHGATSFVVRENGGEIVARWPD